MKMGIMSDKTLISKCVDPLQRSVSQTEQCSTLSLKTEQMLSCSLCFVQERVIVLTPETVSENVISDSEISCVPSLPSTTTFMQTG